MVLHRGQGTGYLRICAGLGVYSDSCFSSSLHIASHKDKDIPIYMRQSAGKLFRSGRHTRPNLKLRQRALVSLLAFCSQSWHLKYHSTET